MERPRLAGVRFQSIGQQDNVLLVARFEEKEVKAVVWDCGSAGRESRERTRFWLAIKGRGPL